VSASISLDGITRSFGSADRAAVCAVTLDVDPGSCTAIVGPSGSGKSTILRIIAGLEQPSSGHVRIDGVDVTAVRAEERGVGMVFQRPLLFPHLSVIDNVAFAARVSGVPRAEARRRASPYLELVRLDGFGHRRVCTLSGGQEQRVALARTLAARPRVLLLDEPFSALDPELRAEMHELLATLRAELAPTIVIVTHDHEEAASVADRIAVIEGGRLLQHDSVDRVYSRPASAAVARLLGGRNIIDGCVTAGVHLSPLGRIPVTDADDGPGALVIRQESVRISALSTAGTDELCGHVASTRTRGARREVIVRLGEGMVTAEVPIGAGLTIGDAVSVRLPAGAVSVVRAETTPAPSLVAA
jgi:putative spermidine/putrescine transport system ATP-binding protein